MVTAGVQAPLIWQVYIPLSAIVVVAMVNVDVVAVGLLAAVIRVAP